jgi:hypothetical protein
MKNPLFPIYHHIHYQVGGHPVSVLSWKDEVLCAANKLPGFLRK